MCYPLYFLVYFIQRRRRQHSRTEKLFNLQWKKDCEPKHCKVSPKSAVWTEPFGRLFGNNDAGKIQMVLKVSESQWATKTKFHSAKTGRVSDGYLNTRVNNPKLYSWVDPTWGESGEGFVTDPKKGKNRDGGAGGGRIWDVENEREFISRSVPDVPVCCRPLCYALLFLVRRGIQGKEEYSLVLSALHFFTLKRSRTPASSLNSPFSASCLLRV